MLSNSSIFNFNALFIRLSEDLERARSLGSINWPAFGPTLLLAVLGLGAIVVARRYRPALRIGLLTFGSLCILRAALFYTPLTWYVFFKIYEPEDIGFREKNMVAYNIDKYFKRSETTDYLVIGSSQTRMFKELSVENRKFSMYAFAGMMPIEYNLYEQLISDRKPADIILYLSEFDLAREPAIAAIELDPLPLSKVAWLYENLTSLFDSASAISAIKHMAMGQLLPEYQHGYLFRPITTKFFGSATTSQQPSLTADEWAIAQAKGLRDKLDEKYLGTNARLVEEFVGNCIANGARVHIFEGQYHPAAYDDKLNSLRSKSRDLLAKIATQHQEVEFIPLEQQPHLTAENFVDGYHTTTETNHWFPRALFAMIRKPNVADVKPHSDGA